MPYAIEGLNETLKALRKFSPEVYKQMNSEIRPALRVIVKDARQNLPTDIPGLSNWTAFAERTSRTSRARAFPQYDATIARKGITFSMARQKPNNKGWSAFYTIFNRSAAGAIVETAGRKNPFGDPKSQSNNKFAGAHFNRSIQSAVGKFEQVGQGNKNRGRVIYKAVYKDQGAIRGKIIDAINKAIDTANDQMKRVA